MKSRQADIERDNKKLVETILKVQKTEKTRKIRPTSAYIEGHSNVKARQRTQVQIHQENKQLLRRILTSKTSFSRNKWQQEEVERRKLLNNISRFSHRKPSRTNPSLTEDEGDYILGMSAIIRTGSPATHLRRRPMSATSQVTRHKNDLSVAEVSGITQAMSELYATSGEKVSSTTATLRQSGHNHMIQARPIISKDDM